MHHKKIFFILLMALFSLAALFSKDSEKDKTVKQEGSQASTIEQNKWGRLEVPKVPKVEPVPQVPKPMIPVKTANTKILQLPGIDPNVTKLQKEIQDIIKLNEELKNRYKSQALEIQRISEQAKIHQKILEEMNEASRKTPVLKPQDTEELLKQEKLRMIRQETEANQNFIEGLQDKNSIQPVDAAGTEKPAKTS
ncbi:MAG: hypothetical protein HYZ83_08650 [Candidatus Omnitrophica bacterium]|nr:hypothetical protein [Candidatus Omnitrophota bacterium]